MTARKPKRRPKRKPQADAKPKRWSKCFGTRPGCTVRLYEHGLTIWRETRGDGQPPRRESTGLRDRGQAVEEARDYHAKLSLGIVSRRAGPTLGGTVDAFLARQEDRAAELSAGAVRDARRCAEFWKAALGAERDPARLTQDDLETVMRRRRAGLLSPRGVVMAADKARPVRVRAVAADLEFLRVCLRWATIKKRLFSENVMAGFEIPDDPNPRRPVATSDRYEKTRDVAGEVTMELRGGGKRWQVPSWLPELLDLAHFTGRRIGAICALRYDDLRLAVTSDNPHGAIVWPADTDKMGKAWEAPLHPLARSAIDRVLVDREVGQRATWPASAWLFPSPRNPARCVSKDLAAAWLEEGEKEAKLPKLDGSLWHAYRRGWATARKAFPLSDVAAAGGWKNTATLSTIYQQADRATVRNVVLGPAEIREK